MHVVAWLFFTTVCIASLLVASRYRAGFVITLAICSILGGMLLVTGIGLLIRELGFKASQGVLAVMFQLLMTVTVVGLLNIMNVVSSGIVNAQGAFHKRYNAPNTRRFPVSFVLEQASQIKKGYTWFWCIGSAMMLYGVWFKMKF